MGGGASTCCPAHSAVQHAIKLTAKLKSLTAFSLLAAYPPPRYVDSSGGKNE